MFTRVSILILSLLLLSYSNSLSQELNYIHYTANSGLPSSTVYRVLQDKKGFIWFATELGVSRFDGKKFTNFSTKDGLIDNTILEMFEDSKGRLWLLGLSGRAAYIKDGKIHSGLNDSLLAKIQGRGWLTSIVEDKDGKIWISSKSGQIFIISKNKVEILNLEWKELINQLSVNEKGDIYFFNNINIYILNSNGNFIELKTNDTLFYKFNLNRNHWIFISKHLYFSSNNKIMKSNVIKDDFKYNILKERIIGYGNIQYLGSKKDFIFVGTLRGALILDKDLNKKQEFLQKQTISCIYLDKEDNFWFTSTNDGVYFLPKNQVTNFLDNDKSIELKINDLLFSPTSLSMKIATDNGNIYHKKNNNFIKDNIHDGYPGKNRILEIVETGNNEIFGVSDMGFFKQTQNGFFFVNDFLQYPPDKRLIFSKRNGFFIGSYNHLRFTKRTISSVITKGRISSLLEDNKGNLWIGESKGLFTISKTKIDSLINLKTQNFHFVNNIIEDHNFENYGKKDSIFNYKPNDIKQTYDGAIWVALQGKGLARISATNQIQKFNISNGLSSDICKVILPENDTVLWVGTNYGLNKITFPNHSFSNPKIKVMTANSGLASDDINALEFQGDTLWIGTHSGLSFFRRSKLSDNSVPPPVYVSGIKVNGTDTLVQQNLSLHYQQNSIEFDFVGLSYQVPNSVVFKYKLDGLESEWRTTSSSYIQYNFLPPNTYKFYISARNNDGVWSTSPDSLFFTIRPPFYNTWWFLLILIFSAGLLTFLLIQYRIKQVKNREEFKTKLNQAVVEGELKSLRSQMNPHFIFNSMNSIKYFISKNDSESANKYLSKFSKLIRLILDNSRFHTLSLAEEISALQLYLELESMRFGDKFKFEIKIAPEINAEITEIPSMILQPFVENSIIHGIMPKSGPGKVTIEILKNKDHELVFLIDDDGVGRKIKEKNSEFHQSVGISVTRQRLEIMTASISSKSGIKIIDKTDESGNPTGTRVEITVPDDSN